ncbi:formate/nitrite transporter family protein [Nitzschia inconspicua]|uniref:Formate/nitrite transporter family protein n=1 Tax=Nitzschia inconspicua TaxID=303405 RepID=A0A9K3K5M2_9STRA|nr:formate/nitrite transporter family protein [Nitzschia inconspicua]KAG7348677.1 formate/nitrite transporter family protein [Nitzschia inconspicua]
MSFQSRFRNKIVKKNNSDNRRIISLAVWLVVVLQTHVTFTSPRSRTKATVLAFQHVPVLARKQNKWSSLSSSIVDSATATATTTSTVSTLPTMESISPPFVNDVSNDRDEGATFAPIPRVAISTLPQSKSTTTTTTMSLLNTPAEAFELLVQKGEYNAQSTVEKTLVSSILGGAYVGMGAMLALAVAGNAPSLDYGLDKLLFALLFPVNLLLALQCGGQLFTGNTAAMMSAVCERRVSYEDLGKNLLVSWVGNAIGCVSFALLCSYAGVFNDGASHLAATTLASKTSADFGPTLVKAVVANWLVCLAVFLNGQARDMTGKYLAVLLPVSAFVAIGLEHSVANMFLLPAGLLSQYHDPSITWQTALLKNIIPVTIGNTISGSYLVGATFSYLYGTMGQEKQLRQEQLQQPYPASNDAHERGLADKPSIVKAAAAFATPTAVVEP